MRGRKPRPTNLKILQGTARPDRLNPYEPKPEPAVPSCPKWMPLMGKREWRRLAKELHELGILSRIDRGVMALYCEAYAQVQEAIRHIEEEGAVIETKWGLKVNPWQAVLKAARESMRRCAIEMGMTPSSRARVKANKPESESLLEKFLSRGKKA